MVNFWRLVNKVIWNSDIILLVLDARFPELTQHKEVEDKVEDEGKKLLYVINKADLISPEDIPQLKARFRPSIVVSSKEKLGGTLLYKKIMEMSRGEEVTVGVVGYPNVGKSSVINLLKGSKAASTSAQAGHTRGIQKVTAKGKIKLTDTPGVLPYNEKDLMTQVTIGAYNPHHLKEPDYFAMKLIGKYMPLFEEYYGIKAKDELEFIEKAALKRSILKKGGKPDLKRFSRSLLYDWQTGKMHK